MSLRILLTIMWLSFSLPSMAAGSPELTAPEREFDFGEIVQGSKVAHTFVFRNSGDTDLVIERVRSSCGCTAALLSSRLLPPGAQGEIEAVFDAGRFRGEVSKTITLYTNVPQTPQVRFVVRATVRPEVDLSPLTADFGPLRPGIEREMEVIVSNRGEREIVLSDPRSTSPEILVQMESGTLSPGASRSMTVRVIPSTTGGVRGYVMLRADGATVPDLRLSVYGRGDN